VNGRAGSATGIVTRHDEAIRLAQPAGASDPKSFQNRERRSSANLMQSLKSLRLTVRASERLLVARYFWRCQSSRQASK